MVETEQERWIREYGPNAPWKSKEDSGLYEDLSDLNAESDEFGIISQFPMHRRYHGKSRYADVSVRLEGSQKCQVFGHAPMGLEPTSKCRECNRTREDLEATGVIWDGIRPI
jgi:hypothetical protein